MPVIPIRVDPDVYAHVVRHGMPLADNHPLATTECPVCGNPLGTVEDVALVYVGRFPGESRRSWAAAAVAVHDGCTDVPEPVSQ